MASVDYVFKMINYGVQTVYLKATVHLPKSTTSVKGIGENIEIKWNYLRHHADPM